MTSPKRAVGAQESCIPCYRGDNGLEARFECPICLQCLRDPLLTTCGHRFCRECIHTWLRQKGTSCPVDGQRLDQESDLFPDNFTRREIFDLEDRAAHSGCQNNAGIEESSEDSTECNPEDITECTFKDVGCLATFPPRQLSAHLQTHIHGHLELLTAAYSGLKKAVQDEQIATKSREAKFWQPDAKDHSKESAPPWDGLLRSLYERIVVLEQRNHEQEIQLENLKRQVSALSASSCCAGLEHFSQVLALQYCGGVHIWTITHFSEKLNNMLVAPNQYMEYSQSFYTSPTGYRFCARMNVSLKERDYLSLLIHLKKGVHDPYLEWPFSGRIRFTLINNAYPHLHLHETMMSRPELDAFKQPTTDMNFRGFGYTEFISINDLKQQGFLHEDRIIIKIQVQCV